MNHEKHERHERLLYPDEVFGIQGAIFAVYGAFGAGFLEGVYQESLAIEFEARGIPFKAFQPLPLSYRGRTLSQTYIPDFICFDRIVLELKAVRDIAPEHRAQTFNYLKASGRKLGLLVNFGATPKAKIERFAL